MGRKKLIRFAENQVRYNLVERGKDTFFSLKGKWAKEHFKNNHPIVLELACGSGEYSVGLAEAYPEKNFIGIDIKGDRLWYGSTAALEKSLENVAFLRTSIHDILDFFEIGEVSEIWMLFPDPRPRSRDIRRRLTFPRFLNLYYQILEDRGIFRLKTDSDLFYGYTMSVLDKLSVEDLECTEDLYQSSLLEDHHGLQTKYEKKWLSEGLKIKYLKCRFPSKSTLGPDLQSIMSRLLYREENVELEDIPSNS